MYNPLPHFDVAVCAAWESYQQRDIQHKTTSNKMSTLDNIKQGEGDFEELLYFGYTGTTRENLHEKGLKWDSFSIFMVATIVCDSDQVTKTLE